ncbi:gliding motility lipoprotein GldH [Pedobacter glucosidilyticus]|uniref:gliding motility lipoprotein GldH n=1 Tax=Pedobacter glucosidilyticus TaxID=1122941 RepID=UPI0026EC8453|nr:gliding motility lipoprotein GldH [Pedobacter glucosidilyticus]
MKNCLKGLIILLVWFMQACTDHAIIDTFEATKNGNWSYDKPLRAQVDIQDINMPYHIYINFRHTDDYKYANVWVRVSVTNPDQQKTVQREEFQLAKPDGEWLGKGSGNLYTYQLIFKENYRFPKKGKYSFVIEQNMRDNPLKAVSDIGLRIEPAH